MKNILNVNKISLKPIFMSLAILFTSVACLPVYIENFTEASNSSDSDNPWPNGGPFDSSSDTEEKKNDNEISVYPLDEILIANCGEVTRENIKAKDSSSKYEVEIEEEEEDMGDPSGIFIPENNEYCDEQSEKAWEEFYNTLFGDSKSKINDLCPSIFKCSLT